jgi:ergothioneine biosynthesis protein EgtB
MNTASRGSSTASLANAAPVLQRFQSIRSATEVLARPLSAEDCQLQSMPDASPVKWHLAHLTWFFETFILERFEPDFTPHDAQFRVLFNSYYNAVGDKHPRAQRGLVSRPTLAQVLAYRHAVDARIIKLLEKENAPSLLQLIEIGLHHEQQHQELILTDIKHALFCNPAMPEYAHGWPLSRVSPQAMQWLPYAGGLVECGHSAEGFCFDNETPRHAVFLRPYALSSRLVTHGEWEQFIADGGYTRPELWLSMGWDWVQENNIRAPLYWFSTASELTTQWRTFTLRGAMKVDAHTPICHINYFEADAYARWAGARLPTEAEWEHAAENISPEISLKGNFADDRIFHPLATHTPFAGQPQQMFGDVWEWTSSSYAPYPGYEPWAGEVGEYNGKFMCNQYVLRGGSCATPASHIRTSYRNFFPPQAQWQFSGLRLAKDIV